MRGREQTLPPVDVVVAGGGSAGAAAAVAAARNGASVALVEQYGFLGGTGAAVLDSFYGFFGVGPEPPKVVAGIGDEVVAILEQRGHTVVRPDRHGGGIGIGYDPEQLKVAWDQLTQAAGVSTYLHSTVVDAAPTTDGGSSTVRFQSRGISYQISARFLIDATGDANVCARVGATFLPSPPPESRHALTTVFRLANVDTQRARSFPATDFPALLSQARETGRYVLPHDDTHVHSATFAGGAHALMTRVAVGDPTDVVGMSRAESEGRFQAIEYWRFLRDFVPGYEQSHLISFGVQIGIRESRRVAGEYVLSREDVIGGSRFPDAVAQCGSPIELQRVGGSRWSFLPTGTIYDIPLRSLLVKGFERLLVAGRCLSADVDAHASCRLMAQCMAMGQGAGTAVALAARSETIPNRLDARLLREALLEQGVLLSNDVTSDDLATPSQVPLR